MSLRIDPEVNILTHDKVPEIVDIAVAWKCLTVTGPTRFDANSVCFCSLSAYQEDMS